MLLMASLSSAEEVLSIQPSKHNQRLMRKIPRAALTCIDPEKGVAVSQRLFASLDNFPVTLRALDLSTRVLVSISKGQ